MQEVFGKVGFDDSGIWPFKLPKYYEVATDTGITDKIFGFADLGLVVDVPLKFIPPRLGKWTFSGGPHFLAGPPSSNALNGLNVTGGRALEVWAVASVKIEY